MERKKPKLKKRYILLCLLLVVVLAVAILQIFDNSPIRFRYKDLLYGEEVKEFFLENEEAFEYVVSCLRKTSHTGQYLRVGITKRTKEVVFSDYYRKTLFADDIGISVDERLTECIRTIVIEGKLGALKATKYPSMFLMTFGNDYHTDRFPTRIWYYDDPHNPSYMKGYAHIKGNWYYR